MSGVQHKLDRWTKSWMVASVTFGSGLIVAAFTVKAYDGTVSQTLVQVNGGQVAYIVSLPLAGALAAIWSIVARQSHGRSGVGIFTWLIVGALFALTFVGVLTIGPFIAPVPICLLVAILRIQETGKGTR